MLLFWLLILCPLQNIPQRIVAGRMISIWFFIIFQRKMTERTASSFRVQGRERCWLSAKERERTGWGAVQTHICMAEGMSGRKRVLIPSEVRRWVWEGVSYSWMEGGMGGASRSGPQSLISSCPAVFLVAHAPEFSAAPQPDVLLLSRFFYPPACRPSTSPALGAHSHHPLRGTQRVQCV